ncbi:MAG: RNA polymerase sigma factor [Ruminiclostridium sp.]|nr:RNA polymerase sigma factor [Ruminiclostridium sp.]
MVPFSSSDNFEEIYERNVETIYRICYIYLKNVQDTQDAVQDTFLKLIEKNVTFSSEEHEKYWLIKVSVNICKNMLSHWSRKNVEIEKANVPSISKETDDIIEEISKLPEKLKIVVYLHYYDGYTSEEIGKMLHITASAVRNRLQRAKAMLKNIIDEERKG